MRNLRPYIEIALCYLFLLLIIVDDAREIHLQQDSSMRFTNFVEHKSRYLEVSRLSETRVREFNVCAMECLTTPSCISLNMATSKDQTSTFWCELMLDDMFNNTKNFKENATSRHFSKWSPCLQKPCQNGGSCVANYHEGTHKCLCKYGFVGSNCQTRCDVGDGWIPFNNHCYKLFDAMTWPAAKTHCVSLGSFLATINSREENDFVRTLIPNDDAWLGANDIVSDGTWVWEDGVEWGGFISWHSGEPNGGDSEQCLAMRYDLIGEWNDDSCSKKRHHVCKK